jgi:hypothetical protein
MREQLPGPSQSARVGTRDAGLYDQSCWHLFGSALNCNGGASRSLDQLIFRLPLLTAKLLRRQWRFSETESLPALSEGGFDPPPDEVSQRDRSVEDV